MTTDPHSIIAAKEAEIAATERLLDEQKAELRGMKAVARLYASAPPKRAMTIHDSAHAQTSSKVGGRQPGSITRRWRDVLEHLLRTESEWFPAESVKLVVKLLENRDITVPQVNRIFLGYQEHGYVERNPVGWFRVSDEAAEKFGLKREAKENGEAEASPDAGEVAASPFHDLDL